MWTFSRCGMVVMLWNLPMDPWTTFQLAVRWTVILRGSLDKLLVPDLHNVHDHPTGLPCPGGRLYRRGDSTQRNAVKSKGQGIGAYETDLALEIEDLEEELRT